MALLSNLSPSVCTRFIWRAGCEGKNVIIVGAGTIGLLAMQCALALGAKSVTAIDINPDKLALAKASGRRTYLIAAN
jgi:threonine dehydrogenase-like Zn-dependent dehydrogenase